MSKFQHSLGNKKINFLKSLSFLFGKLALGFIGLFFKLDKKKSEIIISSSFHAPWKEDLEFLNFYTKINDDTLLDVKRLYTLWYLSKSLKNVNASILDIGCCKGGSGFALSKANTKGFTFLISQHLSMSFFQRLFSGSSILIRDSSGKISKQLVKLNFFSNLFL